MGSIRTKIAEISFDETESRVLIKIRENAEMTLENTIEHFEKIQKLTSNKPYLALIDASKYFSAESDALKYSASKAALGNRIATAYFNSTVANKLTINFFNRAFDLPIPLKIFEGKEEALTWLKSFQVKF
jgi:hypothetical protein